jgi:HK97 family phage portal protein
MGLFRKKSVNNEVTVSKYQLITETGSTFYAYNGKLYQSDIIRACIRPKAQAVGKIIGKHIRETITQSGKSIATNPEPYIRFLLEEPNPYMTGQMLQEKLATQLELNNNAFAYINRDENGYAMEIYPVNASSAEAVKKDGILYIRFILAQNGKTVIFKYTDIIHLRKDFNNNEIFGESPASALTPLMEIVNTTDQGIVNAVKNSNLIKWLLKFNGTIRPEDMEKQTKKFVDSFLNTETSQSVGAAATDAKFDAQQVTPNDYVPNAAQLDKTTQRIYSFFNTNDNIVQAKYTEDQWLSYYETSIEPVIKQLSEEFTRKLFTRRERGTGNKILFESASLTYASISTKLQLVQFIDRGIMTPNELRDILNWSPIDGGDVALLRKDTGTLQQA